MNLAAIGIVSRNLQKSVDFYRHLGLNFPAQVPKGEEHIEATTPGGLRVMLDTVDLVKKFTPDWVQPVVHPIGLAFEMKSPAEVDKVFRQLVAAGYKGARDPWDTFWGQRYASVLDPDGNGVDLFAAL